MKSYVPAIAICLLLAGLALAWMPPEPKRLSSYDPQVKELLSKMTLDEKIGQMTQPEQDRVLSNPGDMQKYFIGSVLSGGDSDPSAGNTLQAWTDLYDKVQAEAMKTRLAIPVLYGIDAVHGHSNVLGPSCFRTISPWGVRAIQNWSRRSAGSRRKRCAPPESSGRSGPAWLCPGYPLGTDL